MNNIENVVLYFPYKSAGGVSELFLNISKILADKYNVFIIDFEDGYMAKNLHLNSKLLTTLQINEIPLNNTVIIFQSIPFWNIINFDDFDERIKIIFWNLHPNNFYPKIISDVSNSRIKNILANSINWLSFLRRKKLSNTVKYLLEKDSIFFMDGENINRTYSYLKIFKNKRPLLPVIIPAREKVVRNLKENLTFAWIGRITDFKVHILIHLLERLNTIYKTEKVLFKIIGSGEEMKYLLNYINRFENLNFEILGECNKLDENQHLQDVDILFAMGMSALEGAARSIPTFLLDYSYKPITNKYKFIYSYENEEYNLGREINSNSFEDSCTLKSKIDFILSNYNFVSNKSYEWWKLNYSNLLIINKINNMLLENANATIGEIKHNKFHKVDFISFTIKKLISLFKSNRNINHAYFNQY